MLAFLNGWLAEGWIQGWVASWVEATSSLWAIGGHHLIQATLFSGLLFGLILLLARGPARLRHTLCLVASLKFLIPSAALIGVAALFRLDVGSLSGTLHGNLEGLVGDWLYRLLVGGPEAGRNAPAPSLLVAVLVTTWLAGASWLFSRWIRGHRELGRAVRTGRLLTEGRELRILQRLRRRLSIRRPVWLIASTEMSGASVWGILRPSVVLPEGIEDELTAEEMEAVILHELIHIQRWDNLVATVQRMLCCVFWFHPLLWLLDRKLLVERERVCDERVVALSGASMPYARGLLKVLRFGVGLRPAGVSAATASNLKARIERIRTGTRGRSWPRVVQVGLVAAGLVLFLAVSVMAQRPVCNGGSPGASKTQKIERVEKAPTRTAASASPCNRGQKAG